MLVFLLVSRVLVLVCGEEGGIDGAASAWCVGIRAIEVCVHGGRERAAAGGRGGEIFGAWW